MKFLISNMFFLTVTAFLLLTKLLQSEKRILSSLAVQSLLLHPASWKVSVSVPQVAT